MIQIFKQPFIHFLLIGTAVFFIKWLWADPEPPLEATVDTKIVITSNVTKSLESQFPEDIRNGKSNAPEYQQRLRDALENYTQEEMLYREALNRRLDKNDLTVRAHVVGKLKTLAVEQASTEPFPQSQIEEYYRQHLKDFTFEAQVNIALLFFDKSRRRSAAKADCEAVWKRIQNEADVSPESLENVADRQHGYRLIMTALNRERLISLFNESIADTVLAAKLPGWLPPLESSKGWQLIKVTEIKKAKVEPLDNVRPQIIYQFEQIRNAQAVDHLLQQLKKKYEVIKK
ncbi:MAG: peptidyl-prolyl cis-trans isomerase [Deltaproteobacteria bacterium]|nr:peptidyl-prolyl cis-trans isomerase [Deltaproteobacteria bacterium]